MPRVGYAAMPWAVLRRFLRALPPRGMASVSTSRRQDQRPGV